MSSISMNFSEYTTLMNDEKAKRMDVSDVTARLYVMQTQESTVYRQRDYLSSINSIEIRSFNEECRMKMCDWCYQLAEFCDFHRSTVAIAFSFFDRFLSTNSDRARRALCGPKEFQLVAITALYIAVKLHEPLVMDVDLLTDFSRGCYTGTDFESMESEILSALKWRVHGPTPLDFVQHFLALLPESISPVIDSVLLDFAQYQTELSVADHSFISTPPSMIALASVLNAIEGIGPEFVSPEERQTFQKVVVEVMGIENVTSKLFEDLQMALMENFALHIKGHDFRQFAKSAAAHAVEDSQHVNESDCDIEDTRDEIDDASMSSSVRSPYSDDELSPVCVAEQLNAKCEQAREKRLRTPYTPNHQVITTF